MTLLAAIDFWFTKNILGRVLVGLKWSRQIDTDGVESLIYETKRDESLNNPVDSKFFWGLLMLSFLFWFIFAFFNLF